MALLATRCPSCGTAFKVAADQLRLRRGLVRCGVCATVFDGVANQWAADDAAPAAAPVGLPATPPAGGGQVFVQAPVVAPAPPVNPPATPSVPPSPPAAAPAARAPLPAIPVLSAPPVPFRATRQPALDSPLDDDDEPDTSWSGGFSAEPPQAVAPAPARAIVPEARREPAARERVPPQIAPDIPLRRGRAPTGPVFEPDDDVPAAPRPREQPPRERPPVLSVTPAEPAVIRARTVTSAATRQEPVWGAANLPPPDDALPAVFSARAPVEPYLDTLRDDAQDDDDRRDADDGYAYDDYPHAAPPASNSWARPLWGLAALMAVLLLAGQSLWWWRTDLATHFPVLRPSLELACRSLNCTVGYSRAPSLLTVESSAVEPSAVGGQDLTLRALLRNRAGHPQPWPALDLVLTDYADTVVVRRVIQPEEYLGKGGAATPFAAGSERALTVPLTARGVPASGYRLGLFFP